MARTRSIQADVTEQESMTLGGRFRMLFSEVGVKMGSCLRTAWSWVVLFLILTFGAWQGSYRLAEPAWEMDYQGRIIAEWAHKAANYLHHGYLANGFAVVSNFGWARPSEGFTFAFDHPPLAPLLTSFSYQIFGIHEWSARLVFLLFTLGTVILIFVFVRQFLGDGWALLASTFAVASPGLLYFGRLPAAHVIAVFFVMAMFVMYRLWLSTGERWYCVAMWVSFVLGAWTDWVTYFAIPWLIIHYLLYNSRRNRDFVFLVGSLLLPFATLALYAAWILAITSREAVLSLMRILQYRSSMTLARSGTRFFTLQEFYSRGYLWTKFFLTSTMCGLSVVWLVSLVPRVVKRSLSSDEFLVLCLLVFGLAHNLILRNRVYVHDYVMVFHLIPFLAISGAWGLRAIVHMVAPRWRAVTVVMLVPLVLVVFGAESKSNLSQLHKTGIEPGFHLAGSQINKLVPVDSKVMASFWPDIRLRYYVDRPFEIIMTLDEIEALIAADPSYTHYVYAPGSGVSDEFRRGLVANFPVVNFGQYAVFDLRGEGEKSLVEDEDSLEISHPANVQFGDSLLLLGYDLEPEVLQAKEEVRWWERHLNAHADLMPEHNAHSQVTYYWQALKRPERDYEVRSQFVAEYGDEFVIDYTHQPVNGAYPTSMWLAGEVVREAYGVDVPGGEPPLRYALRVSVVDPETGDMLPVTDPGGANSAGEGQVELGYLEVGPVQLPRGEVTAPEMQEVLRQDLGNGLVFLGYSLAAEGNDVRTLRAGRTLEVTTSWSSDGSADEDYAAWVELSNGEVRVRDLLGVEPTRLWELGQYYERRGELGLSRYLLPGQYELSVVVGDSPVERIALGTVEVSWAKNRTRVIDQMGVADGEKGDVRPLDTDRPLRLNFSLDHPMELDVTAGWVGEALVDETRVEVYVQNQHGERYLTTWTVPKGEPTVSSLHIPERLTAAGSNSVILRVPEERGKPHYVGWRAWVDAVFPDLLYVLRGPHDGWVWTDFIQVTSDWNEEWGAYRDLARIYGHLEMHGEVVELFEQAVSSDLRPERIQDINVFLEAFDKSGEAEKAARVDEVVGSLVPHRLDINLEDKVDVLGYSLEETGEGEGRLRLFFRSLQSLEADYTLWLHQYEEGSEEFVTLDRRVATSEWEPGRMYEESWAVKSQTGQARFVFGFWRWGDGSRLWVRDAPEQHEINLGWIEPSD